MSENMYWTQPPITALERERKQHFDHNTFDGRKRDGTHYITIRTIIKKTRNLKLIIMERHYVKVRTHRQLKR
jgi:hypothetical protein